MSPRSRAAPPAQIAEVQAENKGNIDLVVKNCDRLDALMGDDKN